MAKLLFIAEVTLKLSVGDLINGTAEIDGSLEK